MPSVLWPGAQHGPKGVVKDLLNIANRCGFNPSKDSSATLAVKAEFPQRIADMAQREGIIFDVAARRTWRYLQAAVWSSQRQPPVPRDKVPVDLLYDVPLLWACRLLFVPMREVSRPAALHSLQYEFCRLLEGYGYPVPEQKSVERPFGRPWKAYPLYRVVCENDWREGVGPIRDLSPEGELRRAAQNGQSVPYILEAAL